MHGFVPYFVAPAVLQAVSVQASPISSNHRFDKVELVNDGLVIVRAGPEQRVELKAGDRRLDTFEVDSTGRLLIKGCKDCGARFKVIITTPVMKAVAVTGAGNIILEAPFEPQPSIAVRVAGRGEIDARRMTVGTLIAAVHGAGRIIYSGDPRVTSSVSGGGTLVRVN